MKRYFIMNHIKKYSPNQANPTFKLFVQLSKVNLHRNL